MDARSTRDRCSLLFGVKSLLRCDQAEVVQGIARYVVSQHGLLRLLSTLIEHSKETAFPGVIALIGWLRSFLAPRASPERRGIVWIARLSNERRAIEFFTSRFPEFNWNELSFRARPDRPALVALMQQLRPRRIFKLVRRLHRRYEFFKVLRVVEFIGFYTRYRDLLANADFDAAVMSSHSNPHGIAFNLTARQRGLPVVLISHGMPIRPVAQLHYELALVHCEAARRTYLIEGSRMDRVLIHGRRQDYSIIMKGLPAQITVGIFLCKDVNEQVLMALVKRLREEQRVLRILIRPHPKNLWRGLERWIVSLGDAHVIRSGGGTVQSDLERVDLVLGGNSSVLVDAVTGGRPAAYVPELDHGATDLHAFVACGLIYQLLVARASGPFPATELADFYQLSEWREKLRLFANVDEDQSMVAKRFRKALQDLSSSPKT
jgi:hypothetical protein